VRQRIGLALGVLAVSGLFAFLLASDLTPSLGHLPDGLHIAGHFLIFGLIAWLKVPVVGIEGALALAVVGGIGLELVQAFAIGRLFFNEALFDTGVDLVSAAAGLACTGRRDVAERLGTWLHPALVAPAGLHAIGAAHLGSHLAGLAFALTVMACFSPAVLFWLQGVASGRYETANVSDRQRRPPLFAAAVACALLLVGVVQWIWPGPLVVVAGGVLVSLVVITGITVAGFKVSGHVSGAVLTAVAVAPWSLRGGVLLAIVGLLLSWARVRARCHTPAEVAGAWGLGLGAALLSAA
jgi:hypothetical protein